MKQVHDVKFCTKLGFKPYKHEKPCLIFSLNSMICKTIFRTLNSVNCFENIFFI